MGYSIDIVGGFKFSKPLTAEQAKYVRRFSDVRHMKRDARMAAKMPDPIRLAVGLPIGPMGAFFTGGLGFGGQDHDRSVRDGNRPADGVPSLWNHWTADESGRYLGWNGCEKFECFKEWLQYLIDTFFTPWGVTLTGVIRWQGERDDDKGSIVVTASKIDVRKGEKVRITHGRWFPNESSINASGPAKA